MRRVLATTSVYAILGLVLRLEKRMEKHAPDGPVKPPEPPRGS